VFDIGTVEFAGGFEGLKFLFGYLAAAVEPAGDLAGREHRPLGGVDRRIEIVQRERARRLVVGVVGRFGVGIVGRFSIAITSGFGLTTGISVGVDRSSIGVE
jgi:hypothetical protein